MQAGEKVPQPLFAFGMEVKMIWEGGRRMDEITKAVVIGILSVVLAALKQDGWDE